MSASLKVYSTLNLPRGLLLVLVLRSPSIPNSNSVLWLPLCSTQLYDHSITQDVSILLKLLFSTSIDACVCASVCVCAAEYLRGEAAVLSRSTRAGRPLPESWGPSDKRDEERGVVTLGAGAGRCPGPAAAEVEPRLLRTNGACERAVCLRYGQLVTDLVDGRLLALLTTRYGASRSHIRQAKRYLGCELVHLCALTWVIPSRRAA